MQTRMDAFMIAPCGMNCCICLGHQRENRQCLGCRVDSPDKRVSCVKCSIVQCDNRNGKEADFCYMCDVYPCVRLKALDKRYRTKYEMSMLENLDYIKMHGIENFVENEKIRWACDTCGGLICVHRGYCFSCGKSE